MTTVDIVMPVRNAEPTLHEALQSISNQTLSSFRCIVVDDGSSDGSTDMLRTYAAHDPRFEVLSSGGLGLVASLNLGLTACRAPYVARMDADDVMMPERLERQIRLLNNQPHIGVAGCGVLTDGLQAGFRHYIKWSNALVAPDDMARARFIESPLIHPTACFRRNLVNAYGGYADGPFPEDYELWLRWMSHGVRFAKVPDCLLRWRDLPDRLTRTDPRYTVEAFFDIKSRYLAAWLRETSPQHENVWIWGAGVRTRRRLRILRKHGIVVDGLIDIDPRKIGGRTPEGRVHAPDALPGPDKSFVLAAVGSRGARALIAQALTERGYEEGLSFLCIA